MITTQDIIKARQVTTLIDDYIATVFGVTWGTIDFNWEVIDPTTTDEHSLGVIKRCSGSEIPNTEFLFIHFYNAENNTYRSSELLEITDDLLSQINKDSE